MEAFNKKRSKGREQQMIMVHRVEHDEIIKELYRDIGENEFLMAANEDGKIIGFGVGSLLNEWTEIVLIKAERDDARFLLVQALLNFAQRRGAVFAKSRDNTIEKILLRLGFENKNGEFIVSLSDYFNPGAHCDHK